MIINIYFILLSIIVLISTIVMTIWFKTNRALNLYIIFTIILICLYLILVGLNNLFQNTTDYFHSSFNYCQLIIVLTPTINLFFKKLIFDIKYPEKKDFTHFIIPILSFYFLGNNFDVENSITKIIIFVLLVIYTIYYSSKSYGFLNKYVWRLNSNQKNLNFLIKNWISFNYRMTLIVMLHFYIWELNYLWLPYRPEVNLVLDSGLSFVILFGYFKVITTQELLFGSFNFKYGINKKESSKICLNQVWNLDLKREISNNKDTLLLVKINDKISYYIHNIEQIAIFNYSFREFRYSIYDLSKEVGLPKYYLDFIFKYYCQVTFNEYKKIARIYDAVELINKGYLNSNKLDSLAKHVGFASYNPFLINFKDITGVSPFDYNKNRVITKTKYIKFV